VGGNWNGQRELTSFWMRVTGSQVVSQMCVSNKKVKKSGRVWECK
jgi:hypothetical protein